MALDYSKGARMAKTKKKAAKSKKKTKVPKTNTTSKKSTLEKERQYHRGVAMVLKGESMMADARVAHGGTLGGLRERVLYRFVRDATPRKFLVENGHITNKFGTLSPQCDLLVHDPTYEAPKYRYDDFVVVDVAQARAAIEIKSNLKKDKWNEMIKNHNGVLSLATSQNTVVRTFGYALKGFKFATFLKYVSECIKRNSNGFRNAGRLINMPVCVAVQSENYLSIRPMSPGRGPWYLYAVNLQKLHNNHSNDVDGLETGYFLTAYKESLHGKGQNLDTTSVFEWFNSLKMTEPKGKAWINPSGKLSYGDAPPLLVRQR
jgi:hypothetical protein